MDKEVDHWKSVAVSMTQKSDIKDFVIAALACVVLILVMAIIFSMWGWITTKVECSRARSDIRGATKFCSSKKSDEIINAVKGVCGASR